MGGVGTSSPKRPCAPTLPARGHLHLQCPRLRLSSEVPRRGPRSAVSKGGPARPSGGGAACLLQDPETPQVGPAALSAPGGRGTQVTPALWLPPSACPASPSVPCVLAGSPWSAESGHGGAFQKGTLFLSGVNNPAPSKAGAGGAWPVGEAGRQLGSFRAPLHLCLGPSRGAMRPSCRGGLPCPPALSRSPPRSLSPAPPPRPPLTHQTSAFPVFDEA